MTIAGDSETGALGVGAGEGLLIEAFLALHYARLVRLATLVCGDVASAQDVVQTACERAWRSRRTFRTDAPIRPWLDRIVVREAARERRSRLAWLSRIVRPPTIGDISPPVMGPLDESTTLLLERSAVRDAMAALGPRHRAVVVLHLHAGYTVDETALILGVPRETVRSRLRVAREQLRSTLTEAGR